MTLSELLSKAEYHSLITHEEYKELKKQIQPCEDCISRQAVIDINEYHHGQMPNHVNHEIWKEIKALPSVTPQPFINKPCISEGVCHEDKISVLDKIKAEIKSKIVKRPWLDFEDRERDRNDAFLEVLEIIDKYKTESGE